MLGGGRGVERQLDAISAWLAGVQLDLVLAYGDVRLRSLSPDAGPEAFAAEMLSGMARSDHRAKGELYLRGLMLEGKRKSMQPMVARLGVDHQQLQQFVTSSTWDHVEVRKRVGRWADGFIEPEAYIVDDSGFPKDGTD